MMSSLTALLAVCLVPVGDWPHWRGATRDDRSAEVSQWDGEKWAIAERWRAQVGEGSTSPLVVAGRVYTGGWADGRDRIRCLDLRSGKEIWQQEYLGPRYGRHAIGDQKLYSAFCATPEFDGETGYLYTLGIDGALNCWDTKANGKRVWSVNVYDRYGARRRPEVAKRRRTRRDYGYTSSPLVQGDWLLVEVGSTKTGNLVAVSKLSGAHVWASENKDEAGHTGGPVPMMVGDIPCVVVLTLRNVVVTRTDAAHAGKTVGTYEWTTDFGNNIASPAVRGSSLIVTSAYNRKAMARLSVSVDGITRDWEVRSMSGVCTPVIHRGRVYWAWRGVHCLDFRTGRKLWSGGRVGDAGSCLLTSDARLIVWANRGDLMLAETARRAPSEYRQLASRKVLSRSDAWPHVVSAGGHLLCKDRLGTLVCFGSDPTESARDGD